MAPSFLDQHGDFYGYGTGICSNCCPGGIYICQGKIPWTGDIVSGVCDCHDDAVSGNTAAALYDSKVFGIYDPPWALLLPGIFAPLSVFLLTQLARAIPDEMLEAARLETGSVWKILWYIVCPNLRSGIVCMMVLQFTEYWGMAAEPLVLMETKEMYPLALKLAQTDAGIPAVAAASFIMLIPPWLLYGYFRDEIREGMKGYHL